jgi:hypothetical protein
MARKLLKNLHSHPWHGVNDLTRLPINTRRAINPCTPNLCSESR